MKAAHMTYFHCPHLLGPPFPDDPTLSGLLHATREIERDWHIYLTAFQLARIGIWEQDTDSGAVFHHDSWYKVFGVDVAPECLSQYVTSITDPVERQRVYDARQQLCRQSTGTKWCDEFTFNGHQIRSIAFVINDNTIVGVDQILCESEWRKNRK